MQKRDELTIPHIPVLEREVVEAFDDIEGTLVDCTLGYGGHSEALLRAKSGRELICIDRDLEAIEFSKKRLKEYKNRVRFIHLPFSKALHELKGEVVGGVLADIGVSSLQLDKKERGFGFDSSSLDMRMDRDRSFSAKDVINSYSKDELVRIFRDYGEISSALSLAENIIKHRAKKEIKSAIELAEICKETIKGGRINPATLPFQAIRIEVNQELKELEELLQNIVAIKCKRVAIISFHSLEDRIIKNRFKEYSKECICPKDIMRCECGGDNALGKIVTKKPITPTKEECKRNIRARSSKLRIFDFYEDGN